MGDRLQRGSRNSMDFYLLSVKHYLSIKIILFYYITTKLSKTFSQSIPYVFLKDGVKFKVNVNDMISKIKKIYCYYYF